MKLAVSIGDINGIGLECFIKSLPKLKDIIKIDFILFGNKRIITNYLDLLNFNYEIRSDYLNIFDTNIHIIQIDIDLEINFGNISKESGELAIESLERATEFVANHKDSALITLPITKKSMYLAGWKFPGHTEYLASKFYVENPVMLLFNDQMKVALVTIHIPIKDVASNINQELFAIIAFAFAKSLKSDFGIYLPNIAVLGLNPHGGENGSIGDEETEILIPAINLINKQNKNIFKLCGTFPPDGFFAKHSYKNYDGVIAMYHDQGLIPLKMLDYKSGVNFTAGLPIVRVSPDHGTAFDIAGKGIADHHSTLSSILAAINITKNRMIEV